MPFISALIIGVLAVVALANPTARALRPPPSSALVVTSTTNGIVRVLPPGKEMGVKLGGPAALAAHPSLPLLYASTEYGKRDGQLVVLSRTGRKLSEVGSLKVGGTGSVAIGVNPDGRSLVIAHYRSGSISVVALNAAGRPTSSVTVAMPKPKALPHSAVFSGESWLITDLRNDRIDVLGGTVSEPRFDVPILVQPLDGPRSLALVGDREILVSNENSDSLTCYQRTAGRWTEAGRITFSAARGGTKGRPAEVVVLNPTVAVVAERKPDELVVIDLSLGCKMTERRRVADVIDGPRSLARRGSELWASTSIGLVTTDTAQLALEDPDWAIEPATAVHAIVVVG